MLNGKYRGQDIGSGTDVWKFSEAVRGGHMSLDEFMRAESGMSRSPRYLYDHGDSLNHVLFSRSLGHVFT